MEGPLSKRSAVRSDRRLSSADPRLPGPPAAAQAIIDHEGGAAVSSRRGSSVEPSGCGLCPYCRPAGIPPTTNDSGMYDGGGNVGVLTSDWLFTDDGSLTSTLSFQ